MQEIKKVVFLADFLRFSAFSKEPIVTIKSTQWLAKTLDFPLRQVLQNIEFQQKWHKKGVDSYEYYAAIGKTPNLAGWASSLYDINANTKLDKLTQRDFANSLVIGCELPEVLCQSFERNGIIYLDTVASPIRFSEDIINCWRSNYLPIQLKLAEFMYDKSLHYYFANMIQAKFIWAATEKICEETALIVGQVNDDKSLIDKKLGKLVSLDAYEHNILEILKKYPQVLYKPHPYSNNSGYLEKLIKSKKYNINCTDTNYYQLLCTENISHVYGINSGSLTEAQYFNKPATHFMDPLYNIADCTNAASIVNTPVEIGHQWLTPQFWKSILKSVVQVNEGELPRMDHLSYKNTLRRSLNADWNFAQIDKVKV
ncbi:polysialyltransferase family glycosyltransferase [Paraglaciecola aestuariivivens]